MSTKKHIDQESSDQKILHGFPLVMGSQPETLILGSMPSADSLRQQGYYAHKRNAFWGIVGAIFDFDADQSYEKRVAALKHNKIALWDVIRSCARQGSLDSAILKSSIVINDFDSLFENTDSIRKIICNGSMAYTLFLKQVMPCLVDSVELEKHKHTSDRCVVSLNSDITIEVLRLPSTSPANASISFVDKLNRWQVALSSEYMSSSVLSKKY